tara:strand:+ start:325 stop:957 length:633 start_codon:yes stop_codon:yes gene_type:complete
MPPAVGLSKMPTHDGRNDFTLARIRRANRTVFVGFDNPQFLVYYACGGTVSKVLAVLTPARRGDALIHEAIRVVLEGDGSPELRVIYVIDQGRGDHLKDCLNNRGFVGPGPAENVGKISSDTAQMAGQHALEDAQAHAMAQQVHCETEVVWGDLLETVIEEAERYGAPLILMSQSRLGPLVRLFGERDLTKLKKRFGERLLTVPAEGDEP